MPSPIFYTVTVIQWVAAVQDPANHVIGPHSVGGLGSSLNEPELSHAFAHPLPSYVLGKDEHKMGLALKKGVPAQAATCTVGKRGILREVKNIETTARLFDANVTITAHDLTVISENSKPSSLQHIRCAFS
ncbi:hypothetical protein GNI_129890 [Gregarina niphandrodes]|uniref:Uncharacterized protein n=1 Tax=Gregarina niphandrodes TaxID=110365 RepID=A0A023B1S7_GRENI|nr:hypothetical protein GNI_129890 [Gregarina niphandrodes]EZG48170.1 hypothetical protein GNI_129890 [Gregarina niphandrodes]|eukprot:XP_011132128.1 hypothetical protein GNI_129890 [Gregarina niphandrodes]